MTTTRTTRCAAIILLSCAAAACGPAAGRELHVSPGGDDANDGSKTAMLKTISAAAARARPGDTITVHEGVYRERVNPPRGGASDAQRIVYCAAPGEKVVITGSEVVTGWEKVNNDTWKVAIPDDFFGKFNPYRDRIHGDWFNPRGRVHHTGAVYLKGHWLTETTSLEQVLKPAGENPLWFTDDHEGGRTTDTGYLLNVAWLQPGAGGGAAGRTPAAGFASQQGVKTAPCAEGGKCVGWIDDGDWVRYDKVDFGKNAEQVRIRAAAPGAGGRIEIRRGKPSGDLLGTCEISTTGDWQKWKTFTAAIEPTSGKVALCLVFRRHGKSAKKEPAATDDSKTAIWAQFPGVDPNEAGVEINVRQSVFYPEKPGMNYITVRGCILEHAATPWAPPTAEQIGLIGTHWSKGWIIEDNVIRYSACVGVTLGKYGDEWDNRSQSADAYNRTIKRALANGWSKQNIGGHVVRNNHVSHCEQAGIVGSLGAVFSTISGNHIHHIHVRRLFTGAEMAGIKIHASIDMLIAGNYIHHTSRGIWLDWMAQGTRVTGNLLHDNDAAHDLFVEVDHGPFLVDNNVFLSSRFLRDWSGGGAYVHNIISGQIDVRPQGRRTPYHKAHSTEVAGLHNIPGGDNRFCNNIFTRNSNLNAYKKYADMLIEGNVFLPAGARLIRKGDGLYLQLDPGDALSGDEKRRVVTSELLGRTKISKQPFEQPDGTPYKLDRDYLGKKRNKDVPAPGPFANLNRKTISLKVWPKTGQ
jgi:hypothetical protein